MKVYHLTEFAFGELSNEDTYFNFSIITSLMSALLILFMSLACFLLFF